MSIIGNIANRSLSLDHLIRVVTLLGVFDGAEAERGLAVIEVGLSNRCGIDHVATIVLRHRGAIDRSQLELEAIGAEPVTSGENLAKAHGCRVKGRFNDLDVEAGRGVRAHRGIIAYRDRGGVLRGILNEGTLVHYNLKSHRTLNARLNTFNVPGNGTGILFVQSAIAKRTLDKRQTCRQPIGNRYFRSFVLCVLVHDGVSKLVADLHAALRQNHRLTRHKVVGLVCDNGVIVTDFDICRILHMVVRYRILSDLHLERNGADRTRLLIFEIPSDDFGVRVNRTIFADRAFHQLGTIRNDVGYDNVGRNGLAVLIQSIVCPIDRIKQLGSNAYCFTIYRRGCVFGFNVLSLARIVIGVQERQISISVKLSLQPTVVLGHVHLESSRMSIIGNIANRSLSLTLTHIESIGALFKEGDIAETCLVIGGVFTND